jgi:integrase
MLVDEQCGLVEPVDLYLRHRANMNHAAVGTLADEAYILQKWWDWIQAEPRAETIIGRHMLIDWLNTNPAAADMRRYRRGENISVGRLARSLAVIQRFHQFAAVRSAELYKSVPTTSDHAQAFYARLDRGLASDHESSVSFATIPKYATGGRPTPDDDGVARVLERLASHPDPVQAERNHLVARWMAEVGLRRAGVAGLSIDAMTVALSEEGIRLVSGDPLDRLGAGARVVLRRELGRIRDRCQDYLHLSVVEKYSKRRTVPVPIALFEATLEHIWSGRKVLKDGTKYDNHVFISKKTGRGLTAQAAGDIVKYAFNDVGEQGSGHRLRAYFCVQLVFRIYVEARRLQGILLDENEVLMRAAEITGHSAIESLRPYLNRAKRTITVADL